MHSPQLRETEFTIKLLELFAKQLSLFKLDIRIFLPFKFTKYEQIYHTLYKKNMFLCLKGLS